MAKKLFKRGNYESFVFYGNWMEALDSIDDDILRWRILEALCRYGSNNEMPDESDAIIYAMVKMIANSIDKQKESYSRKAGGRPTAVSQEKFNELFERGLTNAEVAEELGVSGSTVDRKKKVWKEQKQSEEEQVPPRMIYFGGGSNAI